MSEPVYTQRGARAMDRARAQAAAAEAEVKKIEAARERALLAQQIRREQAETRAAEQKTQAAEKARRRKARREQRAELLAALASRRALAVTLVVIGASMAIAWPAQAAYFTSAGMGRAGLLAPVVIEGPQWLAAILTGLATIHQARTWLYRAATLVFASVAAGINFEHGATSRVMLGVIYGLASLTGVVAWELYVHAKRQAHSKRSAAERARAWRRRLSYPGIYRRAVRLARAAGMETEQAWPIAWRMVHGADPGVRAKDLARQNTAMAEVAEAYNARSVATLPGAQLTAMHLAQAAAAWQHEAAQGAATRQVGAAIPPLAAKPARAARLPMPHGAKTAAAETARRAQADPKAAEQQRIQAANTFAAAKTAGAPISFTALGKQFGKSREWARKAVIEHGGLHDANAA